MDGVTGYEEERTMAMSRRETVWVSGWINLGKRASKVLLYEDFNDAGVEGSCRAGSRRRDTGSCRMGAIFSSTYALLYSGTDDELLILSKEETLSDANKTE